MSLNCPDTSLYASGTCVDATAAISVLLHSTVTTVLLHSTVAQYCYTSAVTGMTNKQMHLYYILYLCAAGLHCFVWTIWQHGPQAANLGMTGINS
jgi:hypothetical protein